MNTNNKKKKKDDDFEYDDAEEFKQWLEEARLEAKSKVTELGLRAYILSRLN